MKFNKETLAGAVFVVFRVLLWLPVLAAAAFFGAALGDLLVSFAAEHLSPAAVGILAGLLTLAVVRSKTPLHTPFERMEQFKQKHHLDRLASFQLEFTLLCMVAFFLSISGIAVFSAAFDSLCAEGLIVPVGWIVCTCLCLFVSSFFIFNLFDLVIIWSALSILAVGCALLVSFASYAVYVPLTAVFGAAALFLGAAAGPAFLKKMEDDAALFCMLRRLRLAEIAVYLLFLLLGQNGMLTLSGLRINLFLTSMIFPLIVLEFCTLAFLQPFRHRRLEACFAALFHCILLYCGGCPGGDLLLPQRSVYWFFWSLRRSPIRSAGSAPLSGIRACFWRWAGQQAFFCPTPQPCGTRSVTGAAGSLQSVPAGLHGRKSPPISTGFWSSAPAAPARTKPLWLSLGRS